MKKREEDHFIGMWKHPEGGWEIKYQQGGKQKSEYRRDKKEAELRSQFWKATLENPPAPASKTEEEYEHPVRYWERMLRRVAEQAIANPGNREIAATCRALASAATAAMRSAKYLPAPGVEASPDGAPVSSDLSTLRTEDLERLAGGE